MFSTKYFHQFISYNIYLLFPFHRRKLIISLVLWNSCQKSSHSQQKEIASWVSSSNWLRLQIARYVDKIVIVIMCDGLTLRYLFLFHSLCGTIWVTSTNISRPSRLMSCSVWLWQWSVNLSPLSVLFIRKNNPLHRSIFRQLFAFIYSNSISTFLSISEDLLVVTLTRWSSGSCTHYFLPIIMISLQSLLTHCPLPTNTAAYQLVVKDCSYGGHCTPLNILLSSNVIESHGVLRSWNNNNNKNEISIKVQDLYFLSWSSRNKVRNISSLQWSKHYVFSSFRTISELLKIKLSLLFDIRTFLFVRKENFE